MIEILLALDIGTLRSIPMYSYVRLGYACIVLTKIYTSCRSPQSQIGTLFDPKNLKIDFYLERLIARLTEAVGPMECRAPYTFLGLLMRLHNWYLNQEKSEELVHSVQVGFPEFMVLNPSEANGTTTAATTKQPAFNFNELRQPTNSTGYTLDASQQQSKDFQYPHLEPNNYMSNTDPMDSLQLFEGLDGLGGNFDTWAADMDLTAGFIPDPKESLDWIFNR